MHLAQTFIRRALPWGVFTRMDCRFGLKTRGVRLLACETLLPNCGPLPQTSQRFAMIADTLLSINARSQRCGSAGVFETKTITNEMMVGQGSFGCRCLEYQLQLGFLCV